MAAVSPEACRPEPFWSLLTNRSHDFDANGNTLDFRGRLGAFRERLAQIDLHRVIAIDARDADADNRPELFEVPQRGGLRSARLLERDAWHGGSHDPV